MTARGRFFWPAIASVAYVCAAAWRTTGSALEAVLGLLALPLVITAVWRFSEVSTVGHDRDNTTVRACVRAASWGTCLWLAAQIAPSGRPAFEAIGNIGTACATIAACVSLARLPGPNGLLKAEPSTRSLDAAAFAALLWGIAIAVPLARVILPGYGVFADPLAIDYATTAAAVASLLLAMASAWRTRWLRRLELTVADRAAGALALHSAAFLIAVPAAAADVAAPDRILPLALLIASVATVLTVLTAKAATVSQVLRATVAIMVLGAPTSLLTAIFAREAPAHATTIVLAGSALSILVGLIARAAATPLGPERSRWLTALEAASRAALEPEPHAAIVALLQELKRTNNNPQARAEIWKRSPAQVLSVNIGGYLQVENSHAPENLYELALAEPERTLRAEVLKALEVRRPDVRPLLSWFETRGAFSATLLLDEAGPIGFILLPKDQRKAPLTAEEAVGLRILADRMSALLAVSATLARAQQRELEAQAKLEVLSVEKERLLYIIESEGSRQHASAERFARPVRSTLYSPAARLANTELERCIERSRVLALLCPIGVDAVGWAALGHLASTWHRGSFVVLDAALEGAFPAEHWYDRTHSPWFMANGGTLVILNFERLSDEALQALDDLVAQSLTREAANTTALIAVQGLRRDATALAMPPGLARRFKGNTVTLPALADRAEDLRSMVLNALAQTHSTKDSAPLGIEPEALKLLIEHNWPGNDLELKACLARASGVASGTRITLADLPPLAASAQAGQEPALGGSLRSGPRPTGVAGSWRPSESYESLAASLAPAAYTSHVPAAVAPTGPEATISLPASGRTRRRKLPRKK